MRRTALFPSLCAVLAIALAGPAASVATATTSPYVVVLDDDATDVGAQIDALQRGFGFTAKLRYSSALDGFAANLSSDQATRLAGSPGWRSSSPTSRSPPPASRPWRAAGPCRPGSAASAA